MICDECPSGGYRFPHAGYIPQCAQRSGGCDLRDDAASGNVALASVFGDGAENEEHAVFPADRIGAAADCGGDQRVDQFLVGLQKMTEDGVADLHALVNLDVGKCEFEFARHTEDVAGKFDAFVARSVRQVACPHSSQPPCESPHLRWPRRNYMRAP